jgi:hypothetical protein
MMKRLKLWWKNRRRRFKVSRIVLVDSMTRIPASIGADVYLVRQGNFDKRLVLDCPCGCKRRIDLNMVRTQYPYWSATLAKNAISLKPSIWLTEDPCQSHFLIKSNRIKWVN